MKNHLQVKVRVIVPITSNGDTSELHVGYDRVPVPDSKVDEGNQHNESV